LNALWQSSFLAVGAYCSHGADRKKMTQDEIIEMAKQAGMRYRKIEDEFFSSYADGVYADDLEAFAKLVAQHEREACAKEAETTFYSVQAAENIRARGQA
jgi:hypothetical protein